MGSYSQDPSQVNDAPVFHIALTVSAQDEATALNDMARILPWLGRLAITVLQPEAE
jgi:hypothetical protein